MSRTVEVGERYGEADRNRQRTIRVKDVDVVLHENYWSGRDKWCLSLSTSVFDRCRVKEEIWTAVGDLGKVMKALEFYGYDVHSVEGDGTVIWECDPDE